MARAHVHGGGRTVGYYHADDLGGMPCQCWCMARIVLVSQSDIWSGVTASCGLPGCHEPAPLIGAP
jgi:hypothetical protein